MNSSSSVIQELTSNDPEIRRNAIFAVIRDEDHSVKPNLIRIGSDDPSPELRYLARRGLDVLGRLDRMSSSAAGANEDTDPHEIKSTVDRSHPTADTIISRLHSKDPEERTRALIDVVVSGESKLLAPMLERVGVEEDPAIRARLVLSIGALGRENQIPVLRSFLDDSDSRVRANAVEALGTIKNPAVRPAIIAALQDSDYRVRLNALARVDRFDPTVALDGCVRLLESDAYWVRDATAHCLTTLKSPAVVPVLIDLLKDSLPSIQRKAAAALKDRAASGLAIAVAIVSSKTIQDRIKAIEAGDHGDPKDEFLALAHRPRSDSSVGPASYQKRSEDEQEAESGEIPFLARELAVAEDPETVVEILNALTETGHTLVVDLIRPHAFHANPTIRWAAVRALDTLGNLIGSDLFAILLEDSDPDVRCASILALRHRGRTDLEDQIRSLFMHPHEDVRESAIDLAVELGDGWLLEELNRLRDEDPVPDIAEKAAFAAMMLESRPDDESDPARDDLSKE